jgi:Zn-dependent alcohol dehydrogenase
VSTATPTPNADAQDTYTLSALAVGATFALPTGTPTDGQKMMLRIYDNGVQQTLAWNANYKVVGVTLPTTTTVGKYTYVGIVYNGVEGVWNVLAVGVES